MWLPSSLSSLNGNVAAGKKFTLQVWRCDAVGSMFSARGGGREGGPCPRLTNSLCSGDTKTLRLIWTRWPRLVFAHALRVLRPSRRYPCDPSSQSPFTDAIWLCGGLKNRLLDYVSLCLNVFVFKLSLETPVKKSFPVNSDRMEANGKIPKCRMC